MIDKNYQPKETQVKRKLDSYAIRQIHRHGQITETILQFGKGFGGSSKETRERGMLILASIEQDLYADYGLKLPKGITIHD